MSKPIQEGNTFYLSGESCRLEDYPCFDDPSNPDWITGDEILANSGWSEEKRQRWYYFYRPYNYGGILAKTQKALIAEREALIQSHKKEITSINTQKLISILGVIALLALTYSSQLIIISLTPILYILFLRSKNNKVLAQIKKQEEEIEILNREIDYLLNQIKDITENRPTPIEIAEYFWDDIRALEQGHIERFLSNDVENFKQHIPDFYTNVTAESGGEQPYFPEFPVIPSWALLQPSKRRSTHGHQITGITIAERKIGKKIATWRNIRKNRPLFRLWYIQFLFFQEKNLNLVSFYYDFISQEIYSKHIETFQYNHITNYSYTDEDISYMNRDALIKDIDLPDALTNNIYGNEVKTISLASASGSYFRCVLPDKNVTNGLSQWLKQKQSDRPYDKADKLTDLEREELFSNETQANNLISALAMQSFKDLRDKVEKFALRE